MTADVLLTLALVIPAVGTLLIALASSKPNLREGITLATSVLLFIDVVALTPGLFAGGRPEVSLFDLLPGMPVRLALEPLGMLFALVASGLWIVNSIYSIGYMRANQEQHQTRFYVCFAVAIVSTMGVALAGNLMTLFIFYEVLTLSTYPLVAHHGDAEAKAGGRVYLGILLTTSIGLFLFAIVWTWVAAGTLDFRVGGILTGKVSDVGVGILLFLYMYGIGKAALMPLHRWLPAAMVAPTPVSALLHAVAVVKAGVFTVLKVVTYIFGVDLLTSSGQNQWFIYIAGASIMIASLVALTKDNLKARLAYSTVSQLGYIVLGAALANQMGIIGGGMHIATHALGKITLFFCAGAIYTAAHKTEVSELSGLGRTMPFTFGAFLIGALSVIGLPPFAGLWSKWFLALGTLDADQLSMLAVLMISSLLNIAYLLPIPLKGFFGRQPAQNETSGIKEAPLPCLIAIGVTALGCIVLFFYPAALLNLLSLVQLR